jgi:hypothetical protein
MRYAGDQGQDACVLRVATDGHPGIARNKGCVAQWVTPGLREAWRAQRKWVYAGPEGELEPSRDCMILQTMRKKAKQPTTKATFIETMECLPVNEIPRGSEWSYELKLDGIAWKR